MATIHSKRVVQAILDGDGTSRGDPRACAIYEYRHIDGQVLWAVFWSPEYIDVYTSPFVAEAVTLWTAADGHLNPIGTLERRHMQQTD